MASGNWVVRVLAQEATFLVDLRVRDQQREQGLPDLQKIGKKPVSIVYAEANEEGELVADPDFVAKLLATEGIDAQSSILILLDS
jgi:hypothetical protein